MTAAETETRAGRALKRAGWTYHPRYGWHRGLRCAGDRYWSEEDAERIRLAEKEAGRTLWPRDAGWPEGLS